MVEEIIRNLNNAGIRGLIALGETSEPVCEMPVEQNKIGLVLIGGLNPVAAAEEAGIDTENLAMSTVMEYQDLINIQEVIV